MSVAMVAMMSLMLALMFVVVAQLGVLISQLADLKAYTMTVIDRVGKLAE